MKHFAQKLTFLFLLWAVAFATDTQAQTKKGRFQAEIEAGTLFSIDREEVPDGGWLYYGCRRYQITSVTGKFGYLFNDALFLGGGTGFEHMAKVREEGTYNAFMIPIFLAPKYSFKLTNVTSLFAEVDFGVRLYLSTDGGMCDKENTFIAVPKIGVGFKVGPERKNTINLSAGYYRETSDRDMLGIFVGFSF